MSIHPSLSKSRNAQPAPLVSGRCLSADLPAVWTQVIPLEEAGISSKVECGCDTAGLLNGAACSCEAAANAERLRRSLRRVSCSGDLTFGCRILKVKGGSKS